MKTNYKLFFIGFFLFSFLSSISQDKESRLIQLINLDSNKVNLFIKYPRFKHDLEPGGFIQWKNDHPLLYKKEMWYYTESFYIKRDHLTQGVTLNEAAIDVSRFEAQRQATVETIITLDGFKDALVLIPGNDLIYKPN
jgi:hypothetical protein